MDVWYRFDRDDNDKGRTNNINMSLRNLFQAKSMDGEKEKKTDLFKLDFSTSINMEAEKRKKQMQLIVFITLGVVTSFLIYKSLKK